MRHDTFCHTAPGMEQARPDRLFSLSNALQSAEAAASVQPLAPALQRPSGGEELHTARRGLSLSPPVSDNEAHREFCQKNEAIDSDVMARHGLLEPRAHGPEWYKSWPDTHHHGAQKSTTPSKAAAKATRAIPEESPQSGVYVGCRWQANMWLRCINKDGSMEVPKSLPRPPTHHRCCALDADCAASRCQA